MGSPSPILLLQPRRPDPAPRPFYRRQAFFRAALMLPFTLALPFVATLTSDIMDSVGSGPTIEVRTDGHPSIKTPSGRARKTHDEAGAPDSTASVQPVLGEQASAQSMNDLSADGEAEPGMLTEILGLGTL